MGGQDPRMVIPFLPEKEVAARHPPGLRYKALPWTDVSTMYLKSHKILSDKYVIWRTTFWFIKSIKKNCKKGLHERGALAQQTDRMGNKLYPFSRRKDASAVPPKSIAIRRTAGKLIMFAHRASFPRSDER